MTDYTFPESNINAGWLARFPHYKLCIDTPRVDSLSEAECVRLQLEDEEYLTKCCMKLIPALFNDSFSYYWNHEKQKDMVGAAEIGLVRAIRSWEPRRASLATWAWKLAKQEAVAVLDLETTFENSTFSYHPDDDVDMENYVEPDWLSDDGTAEGAMEAEATIQMLKRRLGSIDGQILDMMVAGYTQAEIATLLGVSQPTASRRIAAIEQYIEESS